MFPNGHRRLFVTLLAGVLLAAPPAWACDVCSSPFNARRSSGRPVAGAMMTTPTANTLGKGHGSVEFLFEQQRYNSIQAEDAHQLHEDGRDIHGKNHEELYYLNAGYGVLEAVDLYVIAPVVSRTSIQIHSHSALGRGERASGFGDLRIVGKYRFWERGADGALLLGVKAPTGETSDTDQRGVKFEGEQQPGSGSWDFTTGLAASRSIGQTSPRRRRSSTRTAGKARKTGNSATCTAMTPGSRTRCGRSASIRM